MIDNIGFYNKNAKLYEQSIKNANISDQLINFLNLLPKGSKILDGGCGTGRDSLHMINNGYCVTAFDASEKMVEIASKNTGLNITVNTFEEINLKDDYFDGVWCMSSLLHVDRDDMLNVIKKLYQSLKIGGYFYCTFKLRDCDFSDGTRSFTCYNKREFEELIHQTSFAIISICELNDSRPNKNDEKWLCALLRKS